MDLARRVVGSLFVVSLLAALSVEAADLQRRDRGAATTSTSSSQPTELDTGDPGGLEGEWAAPKLDNPGGRSSASKTVNNRGGKGNGRWATTSTQPPDTEPPDPTTTLLSPTTTTVPEAATTTAPPPPTTTTTAPPPPTTTAPPTTTTTTAPPPPPTTTTAPPPTTTTVAAPPGPGPSWFPNASTTGVPAGVTLTPSAGFTVTTPGTVIDGLDITGCLQVLADNVTIRNTRVRGVCYGGTIRVGQGHSGVLIEDVEIDGTGSGPGDAWLLGLSGFTCRRCNIHHGGNGIRIGSNVTVEDSYIHHIVDLGQGHFTAVGCNGGHNIVLRHNTIDNPSGGSAALAFYGDFAQVRDVLVQDNFINGGDGYAAYGGAIPGKRYPDTRNVRFVGNRWGRSYWPRSGQWGPIYGFDPSDPGNVWSDNAFTDGQVVNPM